MNHDFDIVQDQPDGNASHGNALDNDKHRFNLHITERVLFIGWLVK